MAGTYNAGTVKAYLEMNEGNWYSELAKANTAVDGAAKYQQQRFGAIRAAADRAANGFLAVGAAAGIGIAAVTKLAMAAIESENLFNVATKSSANQIRAWSQEMRKQLGLNEYDLRKNTATFYAMFNSMSFGADEAAKMSMGLTKLSYDMASFYNLKPEDAFQKLQSGISGELEPLRRLGVDVSELTTKTYAYTNGIAKQGQELTQQQKVMARFGVIMKQTADAQGDMARTLDSPANKLRIMGETAKQTAIDMGMALMPAVENLLKAGGDLANTLNHMTKEQKDFAAGLVLWGGITSIALGGTIKLAEGFLTLSTAIKAASGAIATLKAATLTALPPLLVAAGIVAGGKLLIDHVAPATTIGGLPENDPDSIESSRQRREVALKARPEWGDRDLDVYAAKMFPAWQKPVDKHQQIWNRLSTEQQRAVLKSLRTSSVTTGAGMTQAQQLEQALLDAQLSGDETKQLSVLRAQLTVQEAEAQKVIAAYHKGAATYDDMAKAKRTLAQARDSVRSMESARQKAAVQADKAAAKNAPDPSIEDTLAIELDSIYNRALMHKPDMNLFTELADAYSRALDKIADAKISAAEKDRRAAAIRAEAAKVQAYRDSITSPEFNPSEAARVAVELQQMTAQWQAMNVRNPLREDMTGAPTDATDAARRNIALGLMPDGSAVIPETGADRLAGNAAALKAADQASDELAKMQRNLRAFSTMYGDWVTSTDAFFKEQIRREEEKARVNAEYRASLGLDRPFDPTLPARLGTAPSEGVDQPSPITAEEWTAKNAPAMRAFGTALWDARRDKNAVTNYFRTVLDDRVKGIFTTWWTNMLLPKEGNGATMSSMAGSFLGRIFPKLDTPEKQRRAISGLGDIAGAGMMFANQTTSPTEGAISGAMGGMSLTSGLSSLGLALPGPIGIGITVAGALFGMQSARDRAEKIQRQIAEQQLAELRKIDNHLKPVADFFNRGTLAGLAPSTIFAGGGMDTRAWALSTRRGG